MSDDVNWLKWIIGSLFTLILGAFGYSRTISFQVHKRIDNLATRKDLGDLKDKVCDDSHDVKQRINILYEHLLNRSSKSLDQEVETRNGTHKKLQ